MMNDRPSAYLLTMPADVLFGEAAGIERWCRARDKCRPTLLDLSLARQERRRR